MGGTGKTLKLIGIDKTFNLLQLGINFVHQNEITL